ncbi:MAG: flavin reductase family protein [Pyrinomonadaceae bacterium]
MPVSNDEFRAVLGRFASGVTVVTTIDAEDRPRGMTVSAFSSISLDPPLVAVSIDRGTASHAAITHSGVFVVNILADDQEVLSRHFASATADKFEGIAFSSGLEGIPVLTGTLATLECRTKHVYEGGDHTIFVAEVEQARIADGAPLLYFRGGYARLVL